MKHGSNPASVRAATQHADALMRHRLTGSNSSRIDHRVRIGVIAHVIWLRFQRGLAYVRLKELRWFLDIIVRDLPPEVWRPYYESVRQVVFVLGKERDWLPRLNGPWGHDREYDETERRAAPPRGMREHKIPTGPIVKG